MAGKLTEVSPVRFPYPFDAYSENDKGGWPCLVSLGGRNDCHAIAGMKSGNCQGRDLNPRPPTDASRGKPLCSNRLNYPGIYGGCGGGIRTRDLLVMSQTIYRTDVPHVTGGDHCHAAAQKKRPRRSLARASKGNMLRKPHHTARVMPLSRLVGKPLPLRVTNPLAACGFCGSRNMPGISRPKRLPTPLPHIDISGTASC
jgi:hypothetical protein